MNENLYNARTVENKYLAMQKDESLTVYEQDIICGSLMTELEALGVPVFMNDFEAWIQISVTNHYIGKLYQTIANTRSSI